MASYNDEKRELLKMKQGIIEDSDIIETEADKEVRVKPTGIKAIENFFYHNKWFVIVGVFFALLVAFLAYQTLTREKADMTVVLVTSDSVKAPNLYQKVQDIELALEKYCPDFDNDGNVHVDVYTIDLTKSNPDPQYVNSNATKFFGEMQRGIAQLFICDTGILVGDGESVDDAVSFESIFKDLGKATGIEEYNGVHSISLKGTAFAKDAKWENSCPEILGFSIRNMTSDQMGYSEGALLRGEQAAQVLSNILNGTIVNETTKK